MQPLYHFPIDFAALLQKKPQPRATLKESIREYIFLLLLTQRGEWRFDPDFQCVLWEKDFEQTDNLNLWLDEVKADVKRSVSQYETRMKIKMVDIQRDEIPELNEENKVRRIRNRLIIRVQGTILESGENFDENFLMFFGPITIT